MKTEPKEPAYPFQYESEYGDQGMTRTVIMPGLTKREYFAAMALSGLCSAVAVGINNDAKDHAETAVRYPDALIKALNETK